MAHCMRLLSWFLFELERIHKLQEAKKGHYRDYTRCLQVRLRSTHRQFSNIPLTDHLQST